MGRGTKFWFYIYTEKLQFENLTTTGIKSYIDDSFIDSEKNGNLVSFNLYSEFKLSNNLNTVQNSENSKFIRSDEGSINEELEEYVDTVSSKRPYNLDSDQVLNSPKSVVGNNHCLLTRLVEMDLSSNKKNCLKYIDQTLEMNRCVSEYTQSKQSEISPPIKKKSLRKQMKNNSIFKPKTYETLPNYSSFRSKRGFSMNRKSPREKTSNFLKESQLSSKIYKNSKQKTILFKQILYQNM